MVLEASRREEVIKKTCKIRTLARGSVGDKAVSIQIRGEKKRKEAVGERGAVN